MLSGKNSRFSPAQRSSTGVCCPVEVFNRNLPDQELNEFLLIFRRKAPHNLLESQERVGDRRHRLFYFRARYSLGESPSNALNWREKWNGSW